MTFTKTFSKTLKILTLSLACVGGVSMANAADSLSINLTANQVVTQNGKTTLKNVAKAGSGDVIRYSATYRNNIDRPMTDVAITLPVPKNMVYTGVTSSEPIQASLDGTKFENIPLKRQVNGKSVEVPKSEYRALRWQVKHLPAKKEATVTMDVKVQ